MKKLFVTMVAGAVVAVGVAPAAAEPNGPGPTVTYTFIGPSTAMKYHREYTIVVRDAAATIRVGNYGTVWGATPPTATETKQLDHATWRGLLSGVSSLPRSATGQPCPGSSQHRVKYEIGKAMPRISFAYTCAMDGSPGNADALKSYIAPVEAQFDMQRLLA